MKYPLACILLAGLAAALSTSAQDAPPAALQKLPDGIALPVNGGFLKVQVKADDIIRVAFSKAPDFKADPMVVVGQNQVTPPDFSLINGNQIVTAKLQVTINPDTGAVTFADKSGKTILAETPEGHQLEAAAVMGDQTYHVHQTWQANSDESLYGLGQHQQGLMDIKGYDLDLWQYNTNVVVPFLVSSRGYGILWDNTSRTRFGDLRQFEAIPAADLVDLDGKPGGLSTGLLAPGSDQIQNPTQTPLLAVGNMTFVDGQPLTPDTVAAVAIAATSSNTNTIPTHVWQGEVIAPATGDYQFQTYANARIAVTINNQLLINHWRQYWLPAYELVKIHLEAGHHYPIKIVWGGDSGQPDRAVMSLTWKTPAPSADTSLWSNVGEGIDYYFVYGPDLDRVIGGFRQLTGQAAMLPQWAFGLWQSRDHYLNQKEILGALAQFRSLQIPLDNIVQDWQYWNVRPNQNDWGSHQFDLTKFPDPVGMIKTIHDEHAHIMISAWGKFYEGTANFDALNKAGYLFQSTLNENIIRDNKRYAYYDPFQDGARKMFWDQLNTALFSKGIDAWWMDATEPEIVSPPSPDTYPKHMNPTGLGTGARVQNGYALMNSKGIYEGQRSVAPDQRVFILTRSGFAGEQRYASMTWSGDVTSTWSALRKQISAGLGFSISGLPYWTTDTGGYIMEYRFANAKSGPDLDEWRELNDRWFQFSTFCPVLRVHGQQQLREMYNLGDATTPVFQSELKFDKLRYALFPYIYSLAGAVTQDGYTMMRPLVMDFRDDLAARNIPDQYMFGPAFLVSPVTTYQARSRPVYLPTGASWYDFWTGKTTPGGQTLDAPAPYDQLPLYIRAGSIIPTGPDVQYVGEKPDAPLTVYVYAGADGHFNLYEDDGLTYGYEKGAFTQIPLTWNDATHTLSLGARQGSFPTMQKGRMFNFVLVSADHPAGYSPSLPGSNSTAYHGDPVDVKLE
jgi:alpha-D-xyloside xylohydrolase